MAFEKEQNIQAQKNEEEKLVAKSSRLHTFNNGIESYLKSHFFILTLHNCDGFHVNSELNRVPLKIKDEFITKNCMCRSWFRKYKNLTHFHIEGFTVQ